jgi:hypothetical protein
MWRKKRTFLMWVAQPDIFSRASFKAIGRNSEVDVRLDFTQKAAEGGIHVHHGMLASACLALPRTRETNTHHKRRLVSACCVALLELFLG